MRKRCTRRARPTSTSSSPVANGSSVPAWPALRVPSARRTASVRSCEVFPAGLSTRTRPSTGPDAIDRRYRCAAPTATTNPTAASTGATAARPHPTPTAARPQALQLRCHLLTQEAHELVVGHLGGEARRLAVAAAAARAGDQRHVDLAVGGAQRHLLAAGPAVDELARERRHLRALDRAQVVDDALRVALLGPGQPEVVAGQPAERELPPVVALDVGERPGQQLELRVGHALVEAAVDAVDVDARVDELGGPDVRARPSVLVPELAGVG